MINYIKPRTEFATDPAGIDLALQPIQQALTAVPWLEVVFGRCRVVSVNRERREQVREETSQRLRRGYTYPEVLNRGEPFNAMPNDNLRAYSFFHAMDSLEFAGYQPLQNELRAEQPVALIIWGSLPKVDASKNYDFAELLRQEVLKVLSAKARNFVINSSDIEPDNVFKPFTITETYKTYLRFPYFGFRFDGTLHYDYLKC